MTTATMEMPAATDFKITPPPMDTFQAGVLNGKRVRGGEVLWGTPVRPLREFLLQQAYLARLVRNK